jgi:hypothetical protein
VGTPINGSVQTSSCTESALLKIRVAGGDGDGSDSSYGDESEIELNSEEAEEMFLEGERRFVVDLEAMTPDLNAIEADLSLVRVKIDA